MFTIFLLAVLYLIPSIIALWRKHPHAIGILVINIGLGWTLLGYVVALAWACIKPKNEHPVNNINTSYQDNTNEMPNTQLENNELKLQRRKSYSAAKYLFASFLAIYLMIVILEGREEAISSDAQGNTNEVSSTLSDENIMSYVVAESLNVRVCPSTECEIVGTLARGDGVSVLESDEKWSSIGSKDRSEWVATRYLSDTRVERVYEEENSISESTIDSDGRRNNFSENKSSSSVKTVSQPVGSFIECRRIADSYNYSINSTIVIDTDLVFMRKYFASDGEILVACSALDRNISITNTKY